MDLKKVLQAVKEPQAEPAIRPYWEESMSEYPAHGPEFLQPAEYHTNWTWAGFDGEPSAELAQTAARMAQDQALARLAWHCYWQVFKSPEEKVMMDHWPSFEAALGEQRGLFYLLVAMAMVPLVRQYHKRLGVPENVTRDTCRQASCFCHYHERCHHARPGVNTTQLGWLHYYIRQPYFRLGRFEYWIRQYEHEVTVYRHRKNRATVAMAGDGMMFTEDGYSMAAADQPGTPAGWRATLEQGPHGVTGHPISPVGQALREKVTLASSEWEMVFTKGDWGLNMHIPEGGQMTPEACRISLKQAFPFFPRYWPDRRPKAVWCNSWIFSTCLENVMPANSNLVQFQHELYLCPGRPNLHELWFIFLQREFNPLTAPRDTSLQRGLLDYLASGQAWRSTWMFFLADDAARFGTQVYQRQWPTLLQKIKI
jgi:hypothetical protein